MYFRTETNSADFGVKVKVQGHGGIENAGEVLGC